MFGIAHPESTLVVLAQMPRGNVDKDGPKLPSFGDNSECIWLLPLSWYAPYSRNTIGYLGNTGGSIWIDLSNEVIGVILTNSAHPTPVGKEEAMQKFRPRMYDLIAKEGAALPPDPSRKTGAAAFLGD